MRARTVSFLLAGALVVYLVILGGRAFELMGTGTAVGIGLGVGVLILPFIGAWVTVTSLLFGAKTERLIKRLAEEGALLDTSGLPTMPSGRIDRAAADEWFGERQREVEADPENWRRWFNLAQAYDMAGDRRRARSTMAKAIDLERENRP